MVALDEHVIKAKQMYVTATIVVIYFTVFLQVRFLFLSYVDSRKNTFEFLGYDYQTTGKFLESQEGRQTGADNE